MKFMAKENGRNPEETYPDSVSSTENPQIETETRTRDLKAGRRATNNLSHKSA